MVNLQLTVKAEHVDAIVCGEEIEEYRAYKEYWRTLCYQSKSQW